MQFKVNGVIWGLQFVKPSSRHLQRSDGSWTLGVTDDRLKTVFIADNLSQEMTDKVLCHELTHVFSFTTGYYMDIRTEEIVADFMSLYGRDIIYIADSIMENLIRRFTA